MQKSELPDEALRRLARFVDQRGGPGAPGVDLAALVAGARRRAGLRWRKIEEKEALREYRRGRALLAAEGEEGEGLPSPEAQAQAIRRWRDLQGRPRLLFSSPVFSLSSPRARLFGARYPPPPRRRRKGNRPPLPHRPRLLPPRPAPDPPGRRGGLGRGRGGAGRPDIELHRGVTLWVTPILGG